MRRLKFTSRSIRCTDSNFLKPRRISAGAKAEATRSKSNRPLVVRGAVAGLPSAPCDVREPSIVNFGRQHLPSPTMASNAAAPSPTPQATPPLTITTTSTASASSPSQTPHLRNSSTNVSTSTPTRTAEPIPGTTPYVNPYSPPPPRAHDPVPMVQMRLPQKTHRRQRLGYLLETRRPRQNPRKTIPRWPSKSSPTNLSAGASTPSPMPSEQVKNLKYFPDCTSGPKHTATLPPAPFDR